MSNCVVCVTWLCAGYDRVGCSSALYEAKSLKSDGLGICIWYLYLQC